MKLTIWGNEFVFIAMGVLSSFKRHKKLAMVFTADRHLRFLGPHMLIQLVPGAQDALECSEMHCWQCILSTGTS
jgi:hypothetical protein